MTCLQHPQFAALRISEACLPELGPRQWYISFYIFPFEMVIIGDFCKIDVNIHQWHTPASDIPASFRQLEEESSFHHLLRVLCFSMRSTLLLLLVRRLHGQCVAWAVTVEILSWSRVCQSYDKLDIYIQRAMFDVVGIEWQSICGILSRFRLAHVRFRFLWAFQFLKVFGLQWQSHANPLHPVLKLLEQLLFRNNLHLEAHLWHVDHGNVTMSMNVSFLLELFPRGTSSFGPLSKASCSWREFPSK